MVKDIDEQPDEETHRAGNWQETWSPRLSAHATSVASHVFATLEALQSLSSWVFVEASLHRHH